MLDKAKIRAMPGKVVIEELDKDFVTPAGLVVKDSNRISTCRVGIVVSVSPPYYNSAGAKIYPNLRPGDRVHFYPSTWKVIHMAPGQKNLTVVDYECCHGVEVEK